MDEASTRPDRSLIVVLAIIAALVVLALVVVFAAGETELRDASTAEGVVQRYSAAVIEGDEETARSYLVEGDDCNESFPGDNSDVRVTLISTTERGDSADVRVNIATTYSDGAFGTSEYTEEAVFDLVTVGGEWKIETAPWQLMVCQPREG